MEVNGEPAQTTPNRLPPTGRRLKGIRLLSSCTDEYAHTYDISTYCNCNCK